MPAESTSYLQSLDAISPEQWEELGRFFNVSAEEAKKIIEDNIGNIDPYSTKLTIISGKNGPIDINRDDINLNLAIDIFGVFGGRVKVAGYIETINNFRLSVEIAGTIFGQAIKIDGFQLNPYEAYVERTIGFSFFGITIGAGLRPIGNKTQCYVKGRIKYFVGSDPFDITLFDI